MNAHFISPSSSHTRDSIFFCILLVKFNNIVRKSLHINLQRPYSFFFNTTPLYWYVIVYSTTLLGLDISDVSTARSYKQCWKEYFSVHAFLLWIEVHFQNKSCKRECWMKKANTYVNILNIAESSSTRVTLNCISANNK